MPDGSPAMYERERLLDAVERLIHSLEDATPDEEIDEALALSFDLLCRAGRDVVPGAHQSRIDAANRRHLAERAWQILQQRQWSLLPPGRKDVWQVLHQGRVVESDPNPIRAVMKAAGYSI